MKSFQNTIRHKASKRILYSQHALRQIMKCMHCRGVMKKSTAPFHIDRKGIHISLDEVPAWVCKQCGEPYFEESDVDSIQSIIRAVDQESEKLAKTG